MRILIRTVPWDKERYGWALWLQQQLSDSELVKDENRCSYDTFLKALREQGSDGAWHLEDDVVLTERWLSRAAWEVQSHCGAILQGYSDRKDDELVGSRWLPGSSFTMNQCFYVPGALAQPLRSFLEDWSERGSSNYDPGMATFMKLNRLRYYVIVPSLVQHRIARSVIDPRRSSKRQSRTFIQ